MVRLFRFLCRISTHAPVKERPKCCVVAFLQKAISTHAPVKERHSVDEVAGKNADISTHAPVKERRFRA